MKVYLLEVGEYEDRYIEGVYATRELARERFRENRRRGYARYLLNVEDSNKAWEGVPGHVRAPLAIDDDWDTYNQFGDITEYDVQEDGSMPQNGVKYVTLADDKRSHVFAAGERTSCGIPVPIAGGAEWTYAEPEKVCPDCEKVEKRAEKLTVTPAPFDEGVVTAAEEPGNVAALESTQPDADSGGYEAPKASTRKADAKAK